LKWNEDLNIKSETLKLQEEKISETFQDKDIGNFFLVRTPVAYNIIVRINKWDFIKLKGFR
jgi:hypothetical protein